MNQMTVHEYLYSLDDSFFSDEYYGFWAMSVFGLFDLISSNNEEFIDMSISIIYEYSRNLVGFSEIEKIRTGIVKNRGVNFWNDDSEMGRKYRCINVFCYDISEGDQYLYFFDGLLVCFQLIDPEGVNDGYILNYVKSNLKNLCFRSLKHSS